MSKNLRFYTKNDLEVFLKEYDFGYCIPNLKITDNVQQVYWVEISKHNKLRECGIETIRNGFSISYLPFYDCTRPYDFEKNEGLK